MDFITAIISFFSGVLGSMGFGGGTVLILYLTIFASLEQKHAQGINLVFFLPYALYSVISYNKEKIINKKAVLPLIFWGFIGVAVGYFLLTKIETQALSKLFGAFLLCLGIKELFSK